MMSRTLIFGLLAVVGLSGPAFASDDACMRCHKRNGTMEGLHGQIGSDGLSCVRCHGEQDGHPRNKEALVYFGEETKTPVAEQNANCVRCHSATKLRDADWTHDVHQAKLACAACHQLHPATDPMQGLSERARTQTCVECHSNMNPVEVE
ncbi:cytochrome c3 family protein [Ferrimonas balearica]|uniref:cytochrome c3 family protein n=2 Tax=Ferrimonas balearica TaxID=44012 RepID=UPI001FEDD9F0|nr:cytochrome c3 family protein [Ferrimonas balearica]